MTIGDEADPIMQIHRRTGQTLAETAFREFGLDAEERHLFALEQLMHQVSDDFMSKFGATDNQKLHAKIIIGHGLRARYIEMCRSAAAVRDLKDGVNVR